MNLCRRLEAELPAASLWPLYRRLRAASPAERGAFLDLGRGSRPCSRSPPSVFLAVRGREVEIAADQGHPAARRQPAGGPGPRPRAAGEREGPRRADDDRGRGPQRPRPGLRDRQRRGDGACRADDPADPPPHGLDRARAAAAGRRPARICCAPPSLRPRSPARRRSRRWPPSPPRRSGGAGRRWEPWAGSRSAGISSSRSPSAPRVAVPAGRVAYHAGCGIVADSDPELEFAESAAKAQRLPLRPRARGRRDGVSLACWNGQDGPPSRRSTSPHDAGFLFGDGLFETLRVDAGRARDVEAHLDRLFAGLRRIGIGLPEDRLRPAARGRRRRATPRPRPWRGCGSPSPGDRTTPPDHHGSLRAARRGSLPRRCRRSSSSRSPGSTRGGPLAGLKSLCYQANRLALRRGRGAGRVGGTAGQ